MISIYLFIKRNNLFSQFQLYSIFKKSYLHLLYQKNSLQNFNLGIKIIFYLLLLENNEFLQFYLQKYLDSFSFKRVIFINYLK